MKKGKFLIIMLIAILAGSFDISAQESAKNAGFEAITIDAIQGQLEFLSSDWTEGRETGTKGAYMAADYIASMFQVFGLKPGGDIIPPPYRRGMTMEEYAELVPERTYMQNFKLVESWSGDTQELSVVTKSGDAVKTVNFNYRTDFSISGGSNGIEGEVPVVFAGYGLQDKDKGYDDLKGLDIKGKIVVVLSGFPGHKNPGSKTYEKFKPQPRGEDGQRPPRTVRYGRGPRHPWAAEKGVLAVIEYNPNADPARQWADNTVYYPPETNGPARGGVSKSMSRPDVPPRYVRGLSFTVTDKVIKELAKGLDVDFDALEEQIDQTGKPASMALPGKYLRFKTSVNSRIINARNVVGVMEGEDTENIIVIGGHYDHIGMRDGWIFNGADDNASGTVGVMTIAKAMAASGIKPKKTIVFCAWTGEEKGLIGSGYFVDYPYDGKNILCNLNYDMISREARVQDQDRYPRMTFTSSLPLLRELTEKHNEEYKIDLDVVFNGSEQPGGGSDHAPFARAGIPIFYFMAAMPDEYHRPGDHVDLVNWEIMQKIIQLGYLNIFELSNMDWN